jgi:TPR repeat protein
MNYLKRIFLMILVLSALTACQDEKEDDDPFAGKSPEFVRAEIAFAEGDYHTATALLLPLAQKGDPDAQYALGYAFYEGLGVSKDRMQAYFWIQESAQQGNSHALLALELFELAPNLPMNEKGPLY